MSDSKNPIGVFDSGMGGVSVLRELYKIMPNENYIYYGDSKNAPYGVKSTEEILQLTTNSVEYLISRGVKAVVIACNTATSAAAAYLREKHSGFPIIGLEPALKPAALSKEDPTVIVMATPLTLREKKFADLMQRFEDDAQIIKLPAPELVELVESDKLGTQEMKDYLERLFSPFDKSKIDCVVLGCTHYPFARDMIQEILGNDVRIFDGGEGAARQTKRVLEEKGQLNLQQKNGKIIFENSDSSHIAFSKKLFEYGNNA
ncbi:MAG: glutamate racemase [Faecalibacterium sp.]|nr:glutamate racemase [Ruminococcus sp.]MCM1393052.1 glutamate racemase [Ruminococcus sp.]MCM1486719.1 glutamate racemase [Faecalibacterium sp.]